MKQFLIIPMGGKGQRFLDVGYKVYKPFLKLDRETRIIDNIINNFDKNSTELIVIGNPENNRSYNFKFSTKRVHKINIRSHKFGPLYSIFLASKEIKEIVGDKKIYIVYSDINWNWNFEKIKKKVLGKKVVIFTHTGFHPHLEVDKKSDFCLINKKRNIIKISQKKTIIDDYKKNLLATGCYYFKNYKFIENFFDNSKIFFKGRIKKEYYMVTLIKYLISRKINISYSNICNFVHLGSPDQYEDFLSWKKTIENKSLRSLKFKNPNIMLMGGEGKRIEDLNVQKPFLKVNKYEIFEYIFKKFGSNNNIVITNKKYIKKIQKNKIETHLIPKTKSMLSTVEKSDKIFRKYKNFFLTSCDCYGEFEKRDFNNFLKKNNPDLVIFGYNFSNLQKSLINSHTTLEIRKNKLSKINVKGNYKDGKIGHAGFFWVKNYKIFQFVKRFKKLKKFKREVIIDDYFKYLFDNKKIRISFYKLDNYIHIGSVSEYHEFKYWEDYFTNENRKIN